MKMKGLIGSTGVLLVAAGAFFVAQGHGSAAVAPRVTILQQAGDSAQVEVAWGAARSNRPVTYTVSVAADPPGWLRSSSTPLLVDTLWVPQDDEDRDATACVVARYQSRQGLESCAPFVVPSGIIIGPPGTPNVKVISAIGLEFDSVSLVGIAPTVRVHGQDVEVAEGESSDFTGIGWTHTANGPLGLVCVGLVDGRRGWIEAVRKADDSGWITEPGAFFLPDDGCGWDWVTSDGNVAKIVSGDRVL